MHSSSSSSRIPQAATIRVACCSRRNLVDFYTSRFRPLYLHSEVVAINSFPSSQLLKRFADVSSLFLFFSSYFWLVRQLHMSCEAGIVFSDVCSSVRQSVFWCVCLSAQKLKSYLSEIDITCC